MNRLPRSLSRGVLAVASSLVLTAGCEAMMSSTDDSGVVATDATTMPLPDGASPIGDSGMPIDAPGSVVIGTDAARPDGGPLPPDPCIAAGTCAPGVWVNVTTPGMLHEPPYYYGPGPVVVDPLRPSDLYLAGAGHGVGVWKSTDYGNTWTQINADIPYVPMGLILTVLPSTPATVLIAGYHVTHRSTDGGVTFEDIAYPFDGELYSFEVDPYDSNHILSGIHEGPGIAESRDAGLTWTMLTGSGFPSDGAAKSWYPFFVETGDAASTSRTFLAIAQDAGSVTITRDGGASWTIPDGIEGLTHPHGNAQMFQQGSNIWIGGGGGPGNGVYRSTDLGAHFTRVFDVAAAVVWGTDDNVYSMFGWACAYCDLGAQFSTAPLPAGDTWTTIPVPEGMRIGANHIAVTSDGTHDIFVGTMWSDGVWRYVAP